MYHIYHITDTGAYELLVVTRSPELAQDFADAGFAVMGW